MADISILEVAPRDGLQNEPTALAMDDKVALIARAIQYGARRIEVASFVSSRKVPQMADAEEVIAALPKVPDVWYTALCLNLRGVERAVASCRKARGVDEVGCVIVASDTFGVANQGQTVADGLIANRAMIAAARGAGLRVQVTIAASFGCPFEGPVPRQRVLDLAMALADAGADEIAFADTIGVAVPDQVGDMVTCALERLGTAFPLRVHLHDTRGLGTANAWAAYLAGCRTFDSALGGIGGCPFAPNATGNVATEELAYLFERSGISTGIKLSEVLSANAWLAGVLGRDLPSKVGRAGDFSTHRVADPRQRESA